MDLAVVTQMLPSDLLSMDPAVINLALTHLSMDPALQLFDPLAMALALVIARLVRALVGTRSRRALTRHLAAPIAIILRLVRVVILSLDLALHLQVVLEPSLVCWMLLLGWLLSPRRALTVEVALVPWSPLPLHATLVLCRAIPLVLADRCPHAVIVVPSFRFQVGVQPPRQPTPNSLPNWLSTLPWLMLLVMDVMVAMATVIAAISTEEANDGGLKLTGIALLQIVGEYVIP